MSKKTTRVIQKGDFLPPLTQTELVKLLFQLTSILKIDLVETVEEKEDNFGYFQTKTYDFKLRNDGR